MELQIAAHAAVRAYRLDDAIGLAETDPSADVDGWDASIKVAALATVLMGIPLKPQEVERTGIRAITPEKIAAAKADPRWWGIYVEAYLFIAAIYFVFCFALSRYSRWVEAYLNTGMRRQ